MRLIKIKNIFCLFFIFLLSNINSSGAIDERIVQKVRNAYLVQSIKNAYRENLWLLKKKYLDKIFKKSWYSRLGELIGFSSDTDLSRSRLRLSCLKQMASVKDLGDIDRLPYEKIKKDVVDIFRDYRRFISFDKYKDQILQLDILLSRRGVYVGRVFKPFRPLENQPFIRDVLNTLKADVGLTI